MKSFLSRKSLIITGFLVFAFSIAIPIAVPSLAYADAASNQADKYCERKYTGLDPNSTMQREACRKGFKAGYKNQDKQKTCKNYTQNVKTACQDAHDKGKSARPSGGGGSGGSGGGPGGVDSGASAGPEAGPEPASINCERVNCTDPAADPDANCDSSGCDLIKSYVNPAIRVVSMLVGLVAVISIIVGGLQYSSAGNDPQKIASAKDRISKTIIAFVAYLFLAGFLEFLVPGGIFNR